MVRIGITCSFTQKERRDGTVNARLGLDIGFCDMIRQAGGVPVVIPPTEDVACVLREIEGLDGVVFSGSSDIDPARYGATLHPKTDLLPPRREASDFCVVAFTDERALPVLAVCGGMQELNVHRGGTLHQHLPDLNGSPELVHQDPQREVFGQHPVRVAEASLLHRLAGAEHLDVNSWHHQGVDRVGRDLVATAWSEDGVVEAIEDPQRAFCLGVQWHPENMPGDPVQQRLFDGLVKAARRRARA